MSKTSQLTKSSQGWPELVSQVWPGFDMLYRTKETDMKMAEGITHLQKADFIFNRQR